MIGRTTPASVITIPCLLQKGRTAGLGWERRMGGSVYLITRRLPLPGTGMTWRITAALVIIPSTVFIKTTLVTCGLARGREALISFHGSERNSFTTRKCPAI